MPVRKDICICNPCCTAREGRQYIGTLPTLRPNGVDSRAVARRKTELAGAAIASHIILVGAVAVVQAFGAGTSVLARFGYEAVVNLVAMQTRPARWTRAGVA